MARVTGLSPELYEPAEPGDLDSAETEAWEAESRRLKLEARECRESGTPGAEAAVLGELSVAQLTLGETDAGLVTARRAAELLRESPDRRAFARAALRVAAVEAAQGQTAEAQESLAEAEKAFAESGDESERAICFFRLGELRLASGRSGGAAEAYRAALELFRAGENDLGQAHVLFRCGQMVAEQNPRAAEKLFTEARDHYALYDRTAVPDAGIRAADPTLPETVESPTLIEPWLMGKVCEREIAACASVAAADGVAEQEQGDSTVAQTSEVFVAFGIAAVAVAVFAGLSYLLSATSSDLLPPGLGWGSSVALASIAAGCAWFATRAVAIKSPVAATGVVLLVALCVFQFDRFISGRAARSSVGAIAAQAPERPVSPGELALALMQRADAAALRRSFEDAKKAYDRAIALYRQMDDRKGESDAMSALARMEMTRGNASDAVDLYRESLVRYRELGNQEGVASVSAALKALGASGSGDESARPVTSSRLTLADVRGDRARQIEMLAEIAERSEREGRTQEAREALERLRKAHEEGQERAALLSVLLRLAVLDAAAGRRAQAESGLQQALVLSRIIRNHAGQGRVLLALGDLALGAGEAENSLVAYRQAEQLYDESGDAAGQLAVQMRIGDAERMLGQPRHATELYRSALRGCGKTQNKKACQAEAFRRLAALDEEAGRLSQSKAMYAQADALLEESGEPRGRVEIVAKIAAIEARLGAVDAARERRRDALSLAASLENREQRAAALLAVAPTSAAIGDVEDAHDEYAQALSLYEHNGNAPGQIAALEGLLALSDARSEQRERYAEELAALKKVATGGSQPAATD